MSPYAGWTEEAIDALVEHERERGIEGLDDEWDGETVIDPGICPLCHQAISVYECDCYEVFHEPGETSPTRM